MRVRTVIAAAVGLLPFVGLRTRVYGLFPGYSVSPSARIGWMAVVSVDSLVMDAHSAVGRGCIVRGPLRVVLESGASLGSRCQVECGEWSAEFADGIPYLREFVLERDAMVTSGHYFDAIGGIEIGEGSWIGGRGTQIWTHGLGAVDRQVIIGRYCYVGSAARFAPGAKVGDLCVVGMGAVVAGDYSGAREALLGGVPAKVVAAPYRPAGWGALNAAVESGRISRSASVELGVSETLDAR